MLKSWREYNEKNKRDMRQLLLSVFMLLTLSMMAQNYAVYRVRGDVVQIKKKAQTKLEKGQQLTPKDVVRLAERSELKLFDEEHREMTTLRGPAAGSIASLTEAQKDARQSMTVDYFNFIVKNMTGHGDDVGLKAGRTTAIFRDETDSLFPPANQYFPVLEYTGLSPVTVRSQRFVCLPDMGKVSMRPLPINASRQKR